MISKEEAIGIAHENAAKIYRDLSIYEVRATLKDSKWYVDYILKDPGMVGGGPHIVISAETGEIISLKCEQ